MPIIARNPNAVEVAKAFEPYLDLTEEARRRSTENIQWNEIIGKEQATIYAETIFQSKDEELFDQMQALIINPKLEDLYLLRAKTYLKIPAAVVRMIVSTVSFKQDDRMRHQWKEILRTGFGKAGQLVHSLLSH